MMFGACARVGGANAHTDLQTFLKSFPPKILFFLFFPPPPPPRAAAARHSKNALAFFVGGQRKPIRKCIVSDVSSESGDPTGNRTPLSTLRRSRPSR